MRQFPSTLAVYVSTQCDSRCGYCYVAVRQSPSASLSFPRLRAGLDYFLAHAPRPPRIFFLGGEPLLHYTLLRKAIEHIRRTVGRNAALSLFTNGTHLDRARDLFFKSHDVDIVFHLRAPAGTIAPGQAHVRAGAAANLVFSPRTLATLLSRIDHTYKAGFKKITIVPDTTALWAKQDITDLSSVLNDFQAYYRGLLQAGAGFEIGNIYQALKPPSPSASRCYLLVLAPDGRFYPCDKLLGLPLSRLRRQSIGSPSKGLDLGARDHYLAAAASAINAAIGPRADTPYCLIGAYTRWQYGLAKRPPIKDMKVWLSGFADISTCLWHFWRNLTGECARHPTFKKLHHFS